MPEIDDLGNTTADFESIIGEIAGVESTDGNVTNTEPAEDSTDKTEAQVEKQSDELDSIVDELTGEDDKVEAGDEPTETDDTEEVSEEVEDGEGELTFKYDGEEFTLTAKEVAEMRKDAGRSKKLTQSEQQIAETKKALDAEAQAVAWATQQPEVKELSAEIAKAQEAIQRGFAFDEDGNQVRLTQAQIDRTQANVNAAIEKMGEMAKPPRLEELHEAVPEMFSQDNNTRVEALKPYGEVLEEFGYSKAEIQALNDPRTFLMLKELLGKRELASRVEAAKARKKEKSASIASKPTKAAKGSPPPSSKKTSEANRPSTQEIFDKIAKGEANPADLFMD